MELTLNGMRSLYHHFNGVADVRPAYYTQV